MFIGTAAWNLPKFMRHLFPQEGTILQRYSQVFNGVEINSSFYREHMAKSYLRWSSEVPAHFRFSVKLNKAFMHECNLWPNARKLQGSLENIMHLEDKLDVILVQLPPSMHFETRKAERFYKIIRRNYHGHLALEPRNVSWLSQESQALMVEYGLSKVIADPERCPVGTKKILKAGGPVYFRLHGSPIIYQSSYPKTYLLQLKEELEQCEHAWCIFDNTTFGFATQNAYDLLGTLPTSWAKSFSLLPRPPE